MSTCHIHINGIVQGVGFRPFVYQLARAMGIQGYVKNGNDGVHIFFNAAEETANDFFNKTLRDAPAQAKIIYADMHPIPERAFGDFYIAVADDEREKKALPAPDKAMCASCRRELYDADNRRYRYPFITCTQCGPRYSVISRLPFERHLTTMQKFSLCASCEKEYNQVSDRRFFSQTNSCGRCGVRLLIRDATSVVSGDPEAVLSLSREFLAAGKIVAVKGIGGYLLLCDAQNESAIDLLRERKHRPRKPLAILYPGIGEVLRDFTVNEKERVLLEGVESPIVLLYPKRETAGEAFGDRQTGAAGRLAGEKIAPGLRRLGIMLPGNPLLDLIAHDFGKPLIATSANISGSPIIYKDEDAIGFLFSLADHVMSHDREILIPQDDSVVQVSVRTETPILLRRSRGYAPCFLEYKPVRNGTILATGAHLKSSFAFGVNNNLFVSQFLGSGVSYESQQMYKETLDHLLGLYETRPGVILTDGHPGYFSHQYAKDLAGKYHSELRFVQHHEAHFAAVLGENGLVRVGSDEPVLGVIWDGTGLGSDGNIWGGEFFVYSEGEMERRYHFDYFPLIAGDRPALEPRMAALCVAHSMWPGYDEIKGKFTDIEWNNYQALLDASKLFSSSVGRIFDAVASMLKICDRQTYEGEAALRLEAMAEEFVEGNGWSMDSSYFAEEAHYHRIPTTSLLQGIATDIRKGKEGKYIAAKFHYSLARLVGIIAEYTHTSTVCFSGGVFQNALLVDWIKHLYAGKLKLFFHSLLSPNDENISFGQFVYYDNDMRSRIHTSINKKLCV